MRAEDPEMRIVSQTKANVKRDLSFLVAYPKGMSNKRATPYHASAGTFAFLSVLLPIACTSSDGGLPLDDGLADASRDGRVPDAESDRGPDFLDAPRPSDGAAPDVQVIDGGVCARASTGNACVTCCASEHAMGKAELDIVGANCMCDQCADPCKTSVCQSHSAPQGACISCVKRSLVMDCPPVPAWTQCSASCKAYVDCLKLCAD